MHYYFAPLEGLTDSVYRRLHHRFFPGIHRYYMPFLSPTIHRCLTKKEDRELPLADSQDFTAVPQVLTRDPEAFLWAAQVYADRGYAEVNWNIGCPSGTVVAKGKGAGMLARPEELDRTLDRIFSQTPLPISVKTRVGVDSEEEWPALLEILDRYPIKELIVHPRVRKDFYATPIRREAFRYSSDHTRLPLCYNGDLCCLEDIRRVRDQYPQLRSVMIGRGLIADPGMLSPGGTDREVLAAFHNALLEEYIPLFGGSRNAMFRLKENWHYLQYRFDGGEKLFKRLRKTTDIDEYRSLTAQIFQTLPLLPQTDPKWLK